VTAAIVTRRLPEGGLYDGWPMIQAERNNWRKRAFAEPPPSVIRRQIREFS